MKPCRRATILTVILVLVASGVARAQTNRFHIGPHLAYNFDLKDFALGAQAGFPILTKVEFYPSFDYYLTDGSAFALNADIKWRVAKDRPRWFYIGGGLNITRVSVAGDGNTDARANLFLGAESLRGRIHPFVELRAILGHGSTVQAQAGLNITFGPH